MNTRKELIIEYWMKRWKVKDLPEGFDTYSKWRRLLTFWLEREDLDFIEVLLLFKISKFYE